MLTAVRTILLAEDNINDIELTLAALRSNGVANEIVVVRDGAAALDYLYRRGVFASRSPEPPGLILLDLKMPKVDGLEVLQKIKTDEKLKTVPIVALTSSRESPDVLRCYDYGVNAFVVKPVDYSDFVNTVKQLGAFWAKINQPPLQP